MLSKSVWKHHMVCPHSAQFEIHSRSSYVFAQIGRLLEARQRIKNPCLPCLPLFKIHTARADGFRRLCGSLTPEIKRAGLLSMSGLTAGGDEYVNSSSFWRLICLYVSLHSAAFKNSPRNSSWRAVVFPSPKSQSAHLHEHCRGPISPYQKPFRLTKLSCI